MVAPPPTSLALASTALWQPLGPSFFYRQTRAYSFASTTLSNVDLADCLVAADVDGGPIAVTRDPSKPVLVTDQSRFTRDKGLSVRVFSLAGRLLQTISWENPPSPLAALLYPSSSPSLPPSTLLLLLRSGDYRLYPLSLSPPPSSSLSSSSSAAPATYTQGHLPPAEENHGVADAKPVPGAAGEGAVVVKWGNGGFAELRGLAVAGSAGLGEEDLAMGGADGFLSFGFVGGGGGAQAGKKRATAVGATGAVRVILLAALPSSSSAEDQNPHPHLPLHSCWAVVPAPGTNSSAGGGGGGAGGAGNGPGTGAEVLVGTRDGRVLRVDEVECQEQVLPDSLRAPILALAPSPNGRFLAILTSSPPSSSSSSTSSPSTLHVLTADLSRSLSSCLLDGEATGGAAGGKGAGPKQVEWTGSNAVAVGYNDDDAGGGGTVVLVGPFGETLKYFYSAPVHLTTEVDCVRVVCPSEGVDLVEMVPPQTLSTLLPHASPSATSSSVSQLFTASHLFHALKSPRADEYVRSIGAAEGEQGRGGEMGRAVEVVVGAAGREWDGGVAGELLKAAAFGKSFLEAYNPSHFVATTRTLRVLNAVRDYKVGVPLTWEQFHSHPPLHLITRLLSLNQHLLALRLASFLHLPGAPAMVVTHWARQLIATSVVPSPNPAQKGSGREEREAKVLGEEEICRLIVDKLRSLTAPSSSPFLSGAPAPLPPTSSAPLDSSSSSSSLSASLSPAPLALLAHSLGRPRLARLLVEREQRVERRVPVLVRMGEGEEALRSAMGGREGVQDVDLVFAVLLSLRRSLAPGDLFRLIERVDASLLPSSSSSSAKPTSSTTHASTRTRGPLSALFALFLRTLGTPADLALRADFWYQDDRRVEMGIEGVVEAAGMGAGEFGEKVERVRRAQKAFGEDKESGFEAKMLDDHVRLLVFQQSLEQDNPGKAFVGLSVNGTVRACVLNGLEKKAEKVKKEWGVTDKRYHYILLRSYISLRAFTSLSDFASRKKSPIGYEPFVDELVKAGAHREAVKYVERCEGRNRVELYVRCGEWERAGRECVRRAERGKLIELKSRAPNNLIHAQLEDMLQEMNDAGM
ncbi:hypothetical protein JCM6882_003513 [Rhodosporidiobolus microsporus]